MGPAVCIVGIDGVESCGYRSDNLVGTMFLVVGMLSGWDAWWLGRLVTGAISGGNA